MANTPGPSETPSPLATSDDIKSILGELDDAKVLDFLALNPTILDVEEAFMWLSGMKMCSSPASR